MTETPSGVRRRKALLVRDTLTPEERKRRIQDMHDKRKAELEADQKGRKK